MSTKIDRIKTYFSTIGKKELLGTIIVLAVIFLSLLSAIIVIAMRFGKVALEIHVAPYDAELTLNGTVVKNNKKIYVEPGEYELVARREHFEDYRASFHVSKELPWVAAVLNASDTEGEKYVANHSSQFVKAEGYIGMLSSKAGQIEREKYPVLNSLPLNYKPYSISYNYPNYDGSVYDKGAPAIIIKSDSSHLDIAITKLKNLGDPNLINYEINFSLENVFEDPLLSHSDNGENFLKESYPNNNYSLSEFYQLDNNYSLGIFTTIDESSLKPSAKHLALIKKAESGWELVSTPQPYLTKHNTPNTPDETLWAANEYAGQ